MKQRIKAALALADGTIFHGYGFGAENGIENPTVAEVVFNTAMFGYQEILTDPSYAGQMICFTNPHIGNVGVNEEDIESGKVFADGLIIRDLPKTTSNFRSTKTLEEYLKERNIMGIYGIDTRALVSHLRDKGAQMGAMATGENLQISKLVDAARKAGGMEGKDYVKIVACKKPYEWMEGPWELGSGYKKNRAENLFSRPHVVAVDCGIKFNILRLLVGHGFRVTVVPAGYTSQQILSYKPDALFLSNGPGDPATLDYIVKPTKELLGRLPIFGICLGHQILGQALGGKTYKLKFGHRGANHPVRDETTERVEITVQNHGFAVDPVSLPKDVLVSHINLNDGTVEGLSVPELKMFCVQYHPESSSGPHDAEYLFDRFYQMVCNS